MSGETAADFFLERIAEDEALARAALVKRFDFLNYADHILSIERESTEAMDEHCARWEPARVLAQCAALRAVIELHRSYQRIIGRGCAVCIGDPDGPFPDWPCPTLRELASVYADHPDYRDEWRP